MSGYCGYDIALVGELRLAISRALDELDGVRCTDVEAAAAMRVVGAARSTLRDSWLPFTAGLLSCRAMTGYEPATIADGDLINSWLRDESARRRWRTATDPLGGTVVSAGAALSAEQVSAIGSALSGAAGGEPMTEAEISWLAAALEHIAARPGLVAAFLPSLTTIGWSNVCNQLGRSRQRFVTDAVMFGSDISADERLDWAATDRVFAGLGAILLADRAVHPESDPTLLLDDMTPYAAALLTAQLRLDADTLAATAREIVEREQLLLDHPPETVLGPRAADLLFAAMLATTRAPTAYVMLTTDAPQLAMEATDDPDLAHRLVRTGTDPVNMTAAQAELAMPALVRWILDARTRPSSTVYDLDLAATLADLVAPHLLQLLGATHDGYGLSSRERSAIESFILDDAAAFDRLLAERERIVGAFADPLPSDAIGRITALDDIAAMLAIIETMQRSRTIHTAEREQAEWDLMWDLVGRAASVVPLPGAWSVVPGTSLTVLRKALELAGIGPDSVGSVRRTALRSLDTMTTIAAATMVCAAFDEMTASGRIPPGAPPPPAPDPSARHVGSAYSDAFEAWLVASDLDAHVALELNGLKQTIASDHEAARNANDDLLAG